MFDKEMDEIKKRLTEQGIVRHGFNCGTGRTVCEDCQKLVVRFWELYDCPHDKPVGDHCVFVRCPNYVGRRSGNKVREMRTT